LNIFKENKTMGFRIAAQDAHINELKHQIDSYEKLLTSKITDKKSCPFPLCDGRGNLNGKSATHSSLNSCPNKLKNPTIEEFIKLVNILKLTFLFLF
jgi:hypothetical protein